jgi:hypothetical protein
MMYKEAHCSQSINKLMKLFYEDCSWIIVLEVYNHMLDTLANKIEEFISMKSNPNMLTPKVL